MSHESWDAAYLSLRRSDASEERQPTRWERIEIPALAILLAIAIFVTFFWGII